MNSRFLRKKTIFIFALISTFSFSCSAGVGIQTKFKPPVKEFLKVYNEINILECDEKIKKPCMTGLFVKTGSGLSIQTTKGVPTVITAGHVCSTGDMPAQIKKFTSVTKVMDYRGHIHQAHISP